MKCIDANGAAERLEGLTVLLGSCFSDNVGSAMEGAGYEVLRNPCGTLFNPVSIARVISLAVGIERQREGDFFYFDRKGEESWRSWDFPTKFRGETLADCKERCDRAIAELAEGLKRCRRLVVTFGTAWVFDLADSEGRTVANCHKVHPDKFVRRRIGISEIVGLWEVVIGCLRELNPGIEVIFTVSPIRHLKDTLHGNTLSKATLHLGIEGLCERCGVGYFEAFEIMVDELRDHSWYASDDVHPSAEAAARIFARFAEGRCPRP